MFWGLIRVMIFEAFYRSSSAPQPMSLPEVIAYVWLGQALLGLLPWNADSEIRAMVRSGTVVYELVRPVDLYALWFTRALATRMAPTLLRSIPILFVAGPLFGLTPPPSWACAAAWLAATAGAIVLSAAISALINISLLWTISGEGISQLIPAAVIVLSGTVVPLPLFPDWSQPVLNALPFRGLVDVPFRLYVGHIPPGEVVSLLVHQLAWSIALIGLGRAILSRGTRRLVVQGG